MKTTMNKQERLDQFYMRVAFETAKMSYARRLQVGAVLVAGDNIISYGWNGTPAGQDNDCEYKAYRPIGSCQQHSGVSEHEVWTPEEGTDREWVWVSSSNVLHAESNVFSKLLRTGGGPSTVGSVLYLTHSPCMHCANMILQNGVSTVKYGIAYRDPSSVQYLQSVGINVVQLATDGV